MPNMLKQFRESAGLTQQQLADKVGSSQPQIRRLEAGSRKMSKDWAERLAPHLNVDPVQLIFNVPFSSSFLSAYRVSPEEVSSSKDSMVPCFYMGKVENEAFRPLEHYVFNYAPIAVPRVETYNYNSPLIFDVSDNGMDNLKPRPILNGDQVICLDYEYAGDIRLRDGMVVVVERTMNGLPLSERSIKQLEIHRDRHVFAPRSTDPRHKSIVVSLADEHNKGEQVSILGVVRSILSTVS